MRKLYLKHKINGQKDGQVKIDHVLSVINSLDNMTFIEVGANDGKTNDPLAKYIVSNKWTGVLIEPVEKCFKSLCQIYKDIAGISCENIAIFPGTDTVKMYIPKNTAASSINPKHPAFGGPAQETIVQSRTLDFIVNKYGMTELDLLYIDAEGYDFVVMQTLTSLRPHIIHYEHRHLGEQKQKCEEYLKNLDYSLFFNRNNTIAVGNGLIQNIVE